MDQVLQVDLQVKVVLITHQENKKGQVKASVAYSPAHSYKFAMIYLLVYYGELIVQLIGLA